MIQAIFRFAVVAVLVGMGGSVSLAYEFAGLSDQPGQVDGAGGFGRSSTLDPSYGSSPSPAWEAKVGTVFLQRDRLPSLQLVQGRSTGTPQALNANSFRFDYEFGPDLTVFRRGTLCDLEFRWFQVHDWIANGPTITDAAGVGLNFRQLHGPSDPTEVDSRYLSQVRSFELNAKRAFTPRLTGLAGFRFAQMDERVDLFGNVGNENFSTHVKSFNNLYGFQLGTELNAWNSDGPFRLTAFGKAGIYGNEARNQAVVMLNQAETGLDSASASRAAFLAELGLIGTFQFTDRWSASAGYQVMWLDGIAMASQQQPRLDPVDPNSSPGASVDIGGTAFYHGVTVSVNCRW